MTTQGHNFNRHERRALDKKRKRGMKVSFSRSVAYVPEWNDNHEAAEADQVKVQLKPLEVSDLIVLMDSMSAAAVGKADPATLVALDDVNNLEQMKHLLGACGDLIPKYCVIEGLEDEGGPVSAEDLVKFPFYMELSAELLGQLAAISMPNEVEEKNSEPQPDTVSTPTQ